MIWVVMPVLKSGLAELVQPFRNASACVSSQRKEHWLTRLNGVLCYSPLSALTCYAFVFPKRQT